MERNLSKRKSQKIDHVFIQANREFTNTSEAVVADVIDKMISFALTDVHRHEIDKQIPDQCWNFMQRMINNYIKLQFIALDRDDVTANINTINEENFNFRRKSTKLNSIKELEPRMFKFPDKRDSGLQQYNSIDTLDNIVNDNENNYALNINNDNDKFNGFESEKMSNSAFFFDNHFQGINSWASIAEPVRII
jgi:hypothetical protein